MRSSSGVIAFSALWLDGKPQVTRPRTEKAMTPDELRIGYRFANPNDKGQGDMGFFDGCIGEVIVFSRNLSDAERNSVDDYLRRKHAPLLALKGVPKRPPVQML